MKITSLAILMFGLFFAETAFAQDCPFGLVNDPYPGRCGRYIDADNNGFCDYSQDLALNGETNQLASQPSAGQIADKDRPKTDYYLWQITLAIGAAWFLSVQLVKTGKLSLSTQRKFWNVLLFVSFLATAATSTIMLLNSSYDASVKVTFSLVFWHIESGLAMIIISALHIFWHISYIKSYFPKKSRQP
jgi:hypothetical protein